MSLDNAGQGGGAETVDAAPPADTPARGRSISLWFLVVPIALAMAAAAIAFFLLSPRDEDLLTTADPSAVAQAVEGARPAPPAFQTQSAPSTPAAEAAASTAAQSDPSGLAATNSAP